MQFVPDSSSRRVCQGHLLTTIHNLIARSKVAKIRESVEDSSRPHAAHRVFSAGVEVLASAKMGNADSDVPKLRPRYTLDMMLPL